MLNIIRERWPLFKKNLPSIIFLSLCNAWWSFNFPMITKLGAPWSIIMGFGMCTLSLWMTFYIFLFPEEFATSFKLDHLNDTPYSKIAKMIIRIVQIGSCNAVMFIAWYQDWHGMSNTYYAMLYAYCIIGFALMYRAVSRYETDIQECEQ